MTLEENMKLVTIVLERPEGLSKEAEDGTPVTSTSCYLDGKRWKIVYGQPCKVPLAMAMKMVKDGAITAYYNN